MARKKKTRKKARTANRLDYTKGGRVGYQPGGRVQEEPGKPLPRAVPPQQRGRKTPSAPTPTPVVTTPPPVTTQAPTSNQQQGDAEDEQEKNTTQTTEPTDTTPATPATPLTPQQEADFKAAEELRKRAQTATQDLRDNLPKAELSEAGFQRDKTGQLVLDSSGNPIPIAGPQVQTIADDPRFTVEAAQVAAPTPETVTTVDETATAQAPEQLQAVTVADEDVAKITQPAQVDAATGVVSDKALVDTLDIDRVPEIDAARVDVPAGALVERVVGTLSDSAKATAATISGQSLRRVTRAKEQLRNAGISENVITELGNDPEALEDALMDLTDEERGLIQGLPEQALVSNQLESLLSGIEEGEIPTWASPAVARVEEMLASRGLSASTVGRDALFNAIIQSAVPLAQSNAQAIQSAVAQERGIEAQAQIKQAEFRQQVGMQNAQNVFQLNMAQFNADQQREIANSKFLQTIGLTEASNRQQAVIQDAVLLSQANLAEADINTRRQIQNAQAFLKTDLTNLSNEQQSIILESQLDQQRLLSNQAAENAAVLFNAKSENQTQQFMAELSTRVELANADQINKLNIFNANAKNQAEARRVNNEVAVNTANAQLLQSANEANAKLQYEREAFNVSAANAVEQANAKWRRDVNLANTAAQNAINQQNAQNLYNLEAATVNYLYQDFRDNADRAWKAGQNERNREADIIATALTNEDANKWLNSASTLQQYLNLMGSESGKAAATSYGINESGY